jgi:hypothetical protein
MRYHSKVGGVWVISTCALPWNLGHAPGICQENHLPSSLEDLDELILRCRDEKARQYIAEAVASYRAGAFRSAIVATWIAVCFDVIEKFRELALAGDKEAERQVQDVETTRRTGDLSRALKFERELLELARDKFELISPLEYIDLDRLQADRNRCAHPSLTSEDQAYVPSAELARLHLHSAVTHLLQHPPVQGKYALDRLVKEIDSDYFPSSAKAARVAFGSGPLRRPRESLVRNLVLVLCKALLKDKPDWKRRSRISAALQAIQELHPAYCSKALMETLSNMFRGVSDEALLATINFLQSVPDSWQYLEADVRQRLENYVSSLPSDDIDELDFLLRYVPLQGYARSRVKVATKKELRDKVPFDLPTEVADRCIDLYLESRSSDDANDWAKFLMIYSGDFTADHVRRLLQNAGKNAKVRGSSQLGQLVTKLRSHNKLPDDEFESLLQQNGLE